MVTGIFLCLSIFLNWILIEHLLIYIPFLIIVSFSIVFVWLFGAWIGKSCFLSPSAP